LFPCFEDGQENPPLVTPEVTRPSFFAKLVGGLPPIIKADSLIVKFFGFSNLLRNCSA